MHRRLPVLRQVGLALLAFAVWVTGGVDANGAEKLAARPQIEPLLREYCFDCHGDGMKKGKFDLEGLLQLGKAEDKDGHWQKTWKILRHGFMPPADADPLPNDAREAITRWIAEQHLGVDLKNPDPGRVTMRRLNRMEYEFTVSDLFETDFTVDPRFRPDPTASMPRLRDMLPPDDTAYGFDNIGDFQTLSPALLEKYFQLAELIVERTIAVHGPQPLERGLSHEGLRVERNRERGEAVHRLPVKVEKPGRYRFAMQFRLGGWQESDGTYNVEVALNDSAIGRETVETGGEKTYTIAREVELAPGEASLLYTTKSAAEQQDGGSRQSPLELRPRMWLIGPLDRDLVVPESHRRIFFRGEPPADLAARQTYARDIMKRVADRAFRRPVEDGMLERLTKLVMSAPTFEQGVAEGVMAILVSPKFLFRTEVQPRPDDPRTIHPLDEFALASRLSYFLWLSIPDEELMRLAERGELRKNLRTQVKRMLAHPKSGRFFEDFTGQWLRTRNVLMAAITRRVDDLVNPLRGAMKRETDLLFEDIARHDRDLLELVTADYTFVNRELARYYGLPEVHGRDFQRVQLPPDSKRGGILTHASFLMSTSNPNRTSPVKRGLFVLENLLAIEPPPPPPTVGALEDAKATDGRSPQTVREQLALHREEKSCAACHAHFDPIGIALENFDLIGRWRDKERSGEAIVPDEVTVTGQRLRGIEDLKAYFASQKERFYGCVTEKLLTYALGRGLEPSDAYLVDRIAARLQADKGKFSTLLFEVIESAPFQMRRGDDGAKKAAPALPIPPIPPPEKRVGRRFTGFPERPVPPAAGTAPGPVPSAAPAQNSNP